MATVTIKANPSEEKKAPVAPGNKIHKVVIHQWQLGMASVKHRCLQCADAAPLGVFFAVVLVPLLGATCVVLPRCQLAKDHCLGVCSVPILMIWWPVQQSWDFKCMTSA